MGCEYEKETPGSFSKEHAGWVDNGGAPALEVSSLPQRVTCVQCANTYQAILWKVCQPLGEGKLV